MLQLSGEKPAKYARAVHRLLERVSAVSVSLRIGLRRVQALRLDEAPLRVRARPGKLPAVKSVAV